LAAFDKHTTDDLDGMSKVRKPWKIRLLRVGLWTLGSVFGLFGLLILAFQFTSVQTAAGRWAASWLSTKTGFEVSIEKVQLTSFRNLKLDNFLIREHNGDTLLFGKHLEARLRGYDRKLHEIQIRKISLENAGFFLIKSKGRQEANLSRFLAAFKSDTPKVKSKRPLGIRFGTIRLCEVYFRLQDANTGPSAAEFRPEDIGIREIEAEIDDFFIHQDSIVIDIKHLQAREKSGILIRGLSGRYLLCNKSMQLQHFRIQTGHSDLRGDFAFRFTSMDAFQDFINEVEWEVDFGLSNVSFTDIARFTPGLAGMSGDFRIRGNLRGTLANLRARNLRILFGSVTQLDGNVDIMGLPKIENTYFYVDIDRLVTGYYDLTRIPLPGIKPYDQERFIKVPSEVERMGVIRFQGNFAGYLSDFTAFGDMRCGLGNLFADIHMNQSEAGTYKYEGLVKSERFNFGRYFGLAPTIERVSLNGTVKGEGFTLADIQATFDGHISDLEAMSYTYRDISLTGKFAEKVFNGSLAINDPNAGLDFNGLLDLRGAKPEFDLNATLRHVYPERLNLMKKSDNIQVDAFVNLNFKGADIDELEGQIQVKNLKLRKQAQTLFVNEISLQAFQPGSRRTLELFSDFVDGHVEGKFTLQPLFVDLHHRFFELFPYFIPQPAQKKTNQSQEFTYALHLKKTDSLLAMFLPQLAIRPNSIIFGSYDNIEESLKLSARSGGVKLGNLVWRDIRISADTWDKKVTMDIQAEQFLPTETTVMDKLHLRLGSKNDSLGFRFSFSNATERKNSALVQGHTVLSEAPKLSVTFAKSHFYYEDTLWILKDNGVFRVEGPAFAFSGIALLRENGGQPILELEGRLGKLVSDSLQVRMNTLPLSIVNAFIPGDAMNLSGKASGRITGYRLLDSPFFTADLSVDNLKMNDLLMGDLIASSSFDNIDRELIINAALRNGTKETVRIRNSKLRPFEPERLLDLSVEIFQLNLALFQPLAGAILSELQGDLSGRVSLRGNAKDPFINGALYVEDARVRTDFLKAPINLDLLSEPIILTNRSIRLPSIKLSDDIKGVGTLQGSIFHEKFSNMDFNIRLSNMRDLLVMQTTKTQNDNFYGRAFINTQDITGGAATSSRNITLRGPLNNLILRAYIQTAAGTEISLPLNLGASARENTFVTFINPKDSTTMQQVVSTTTAAGNFTVELFVNVTPEATFYIIFDELTNDIITARGQANNFNLAIDLKDRFHMDGMFEITRGDYKFNLSNVVNRQFIIKPGSFVTWTGDPYTAQINATAIHVTRAQLFPIVSPFLSDQAQAEQYRRPSRVFAELVLSDKLIDPRLDFDLSLPDSDESVRGLVRSVLNSREEINRQVFALLLLGNFLPPENIGSAGGGGNLAAAGLGGNSLSLVSGQINNWLGNFTRDFNVNLDYEAAGENRGDRVTVGVQGQLFNDRVIIDGDLGVGGRTEQSQVQAQNAVVGNVTVEVKATEDGRFRVRAFNRSNEFNLLKNSVPYTQGVGLSYRRDFERFSDLFSGNKKDRQAVKRQRDLRELEDQITPPTIGDDDEYLRYQDILEQERKDKQEDTPQPIPPSDAVPIDEDDDF